ncbi:hypothetical protein [Galactobacter valiniphilus]|uniref:hypothetical protein n=1 Tax=Galactobacter valiniphilus TaxID=2676122 RepID=UPI001313DEE0|nr:hypothetical protein [Galactobacter valiniphilus]
MALAQRTSGARTFWCTTAVRDTEVAWRLRFPQLTGAPGADNPATWRPPLPLRGPGA